jgi:hypothetical protein
MSEHCSCCGEAQADAPSIDDLRDFVVWTRNHVESDPHPLGWFEAKSEEDALDQMFDELFESGWAAVAGHDDWTDKQVRDSARFFKPSPGRIFNRIFRHTLGRESGRPDSGDEWHH